MKSYHVFKIIFLFAIISMAFPQEVLSKKCNHLHGMKQFRKRGGKRFNRVPQRGAFNMNIQNNFNENNFDENNFDENNFDENDFGRIARQEGRLNQFWRDMNTAFLGIADTLLDLPASCKEGDKNFHKIGEYEKKINDLVNEMTRIYFDELNARGNETVFNEQFKRMYIQVKNISFFRQPLCGFPRALYDNAVTAFQNATQLTLGAMQNFSDFNQEKKDEIRMRMENLSRVLFRIGTHLKNVHFQESNRAVVEVNEILFTKLPNPG